MSFVEAVILGIIQGLTEFLPISSSGHLVLVQNLLGLEALDQYILFDIICHLGTLCTIFVFFRSEIRKALSQNFDRLQQIFLGTLPLFPIVFLIKPIKSVFDRPEYLGVFFLFTSSLLYSGIRWANSIHLKNRKWESVVIGVFQAVAVLPGVSRSGSTITGARLLGWDQKDAVAFSFLLAIPAILGATVLEVLQIMMNTHESTAQISFSSYLAGFLLSFLVGYLSLGLLVKMTVHNLWMLFVWYCLILGLISLLLFS